MMMDVDGYERIDDRLGHHVGDRALRTVANALRVQSRGENGLFRVGGDAEGEDALLRTADDLTYRGKARNGASTRNATTETPFWATLPRSTPATRRGTNCNLPPQPAC